MKNAHFINVNLFFALILTLISASDCRCAAAALGIDRQASRSPTCHLRRAQAARAALVNAAAVGGAPQDAQRCGAHVEWRRRVHDVKRIRRELRVVGVLRARFKFAPQKRVKTPLTLVNVDALGFARRYRFAFERHTRL